MSKVLQTIVAFNKENSGNFVSVTNYTNEQGEISNQLFNVGINYSKVLTDDLKTLQNFDTKTLAEKYDNVTLKLALSEMILSLEKRTASEEEKEKLREIGDTTIARSDAQSDAYVTLQKGLKTRDNNLYVYGLRVNKTIVKSAEENGTPYKVVNSALKTLAKREITKQAKLRGGNFRLFKLGGLETLKLKGITI